MYDKICDIENCRKAILNASRTKRKKCRKYIDNLEYYAQALSNLLRNREYTPSPYGKFTLKQDGLSHKERVISTTQFFPDQCVYWALLQVTGGILRRGTYAYSCAGIKGKGTLFASRRIRKWFQDDSKHTKYCLKMDIKQFYPSMDNGI